MRRYRGARYRWKNLAPQELDQKIADIEGKMLRGETEFGGSEELELRNMADYRLNSAKTAETERAALMKLIISLNKRAAAKRKLAGK